MSILLIKGCYTISGIRAAMIIVNCPCPSANSAYMLRSLTLDTITNLFDSILNIKYNLYKFFLGNYCLSVSLKIKPKNLKVILNYK